MLVSHISHMQAPVTQIKSFFLKLILTVAFRIPRLFHLHVRNVHQLESADISVKPVYCIIHVRGSFIEISLLISYLLVVQIDVEERLIQVVLYKTELLETESIFVLSV